MTLGVLHCPPRTCPAWLLAAALFSVAAIAQQMGPKIIVTAEQVAAAAANSVLSPALRQYAADIGRLAINVESGGNLGIYNGTCCTGVLQVNKGGLKVYCGCTSEQYASMTLDQQMQVWAKLTNANAANSVVRNLMAMGSFGGRAVDGAMVLSCIQIGPGNCAKTLRTGTCATNAGADGNGNNFCDFAGKIRGGAASPSPAPAPSPAPNPNPEPAAGGTPAAPWTPVSASAAFYAGAGVDMDTVREAVREAVCAAALLWAAWVAQAQFFSWRRGRTSLAALEASVIGVAVLTSLLLFITLN